MGKQEAPVGPTESAGHAMPLQSSLSSGNRIPSQNSLPLPGRRLSVMDQQPRFGLQALQSFPQQFVQLVGHRRHIGAGQPPSRTNATQIGGFDSEAPIG